MRESEIKIVRLEPVRVAFTLGFGRSPEAEAWEKLLSWANEKGLLDDIKSHRLFGFNNPNPVPSNPEYGYEQWITVGPDAEPEGDVQIKEFNGGLYAVARTKLSEITESWQNLAAWVSESAYEFASHQSLEECLGFQGGIPSLDTEFDVYAPIKEKST
jgi:DNA gyrase inhibitor GyrI